MDITHSLILVLVMTSSSIHEINSEGLSGPDGVVPCCHDRHCLIMMHAFCNATGPPMPGSCGASERSAYTSASPANDETTTSQHDTTRHQDGATRPREDTTTFQAHNTRIKEDTTSVLVDSTKFREETTRFMKDSTDFGVDTTKFREETTGFQEDTITFLKDTTKLPTRFREDTTILPTRFREDTTKLPTRFREDSTMLPTMFREDTTRSQEDTSGIREDTASSREPSTSFLVDVNAMTTTEEPVKGFCDCRPGYRRDGLRCVADGTIYCYRLTCIGTCNGCIRDRVTFREPSIFLRYCAAPKEHKCFAVAERTSDGWVKETAGCTQSCKEEQGPNKTIACCNSDYCNNITAWLRADLQTTGSSDTVINELAVKLTLTCLLCAIYSRFSILRN